MSTHPRAQASRPRTLRLASCRLLPAAVLALGLGVVPAAHADPALSKKWSESLDKGAGPHGWLRTWIVTERCSSSGLVGCGRLGDVLSGSMPSWPMDYFADSLKVEMGQGRYAGAQSAVCVDAFGCELLDMTLEILAASGKPEAGPLLLGWLKDEAHWKTGPMAPWRGMFIRLLAWWGDRAQAPLVAAMASDIPDDVAGRPLILGAGAWVLGQWGDKSLLPQCERLWKGEIRGDGVEDGQRACAFYALRLGDRSHDKYLAAFGGNSFINALFRAVTGDKSQLDEWRKEAAALKKAPDNSRAATFAVAAAIVGDRAAAADVAAVVKSCNPGGVRTIAGLSAVASFHPWAATTRKALTPCMAKLGDKDIGGRALAHVAYALLRAGDVAGLPAMGKALGSSDTDVVQEAVQLLSGEWGTNEIAGHSKGLNGGVPVKGVGKLLSQLVGKASFSDNKRLRQATLSAWVMQRAAGGD